MHNIQKFTYMIRLPIARRAAMTKGFVPSPSQKTSLSSDYSSKYQTLDGMSGATEDANPAEDDQTVHKDKAWSRDQTRSVDGGYFSCPSSGTLKESTVLLSGSSDVISSDTDSSPVPPPDEAECYLLMRQEDTDTSGSFTTETDLEPSSKRTPLQRLLGLLLVLGASLLFSSVATAAKYLDSISSGEFVMIRGAYALILLAPASCFTGTSLISFPRKPLVALRCILHGVGYTLKIWCVKNMNLGDAISIYFTSIIFAGIFSRVLLKEKYTLVNAVSVLLGISGVFLIAKPSFVFSSSVVNYNSLYCLIALAAACSSGAGYSAQRAIGPGIGSQITPFYTNLCVIGGGAVLNWATGGQYSSPGCYGERLILTACGLGACVGLVMLNIGLSIEKSAPATLMRNMDIVIAFLVQVFLFKETADWISVFGAGLIITSAVSVTVEKAFCPHFFWKI